MIEVGEFIRAIRKRRNLTTTQLADQLDLSNGYISLIERNIVSPSLATLKRIAQVLSVPFESFFLDQDKEVVYSFVKNDDELFVIPGDRRWRLLIDNNKTDLMGAYFFDSADTDKAVHSHKGVELIHILEGEGAIRIGKEDYTLNTGDSLNFDASILHWDNSKPGIPRKLIVVVTPPEEFHF